jgi:hypothetical protein
MSQHDFNISNQTASVTRADINNALGALATLSSGTTAPSTTYANMLWYETDTNTLWMRNEANSTWINVAYVDQSANAWRVLDNTQVVNTSGTTIGYLGVHATSVWQSGVDTVDTLVSPAKVKAAIQALVPAGYSDAQARAAQAGHAVGGIGSYVLGAATVSLAAGATVAGSSVRPAGAYRDLDGNRFTTTVGSVLSGTWRCMGVNTATGNHRLTLYLRIS